MKQYYSVEEIHEDGSRTVLWPRRRGWWVALLISPAGIIVFFKHGPFAWNGLFGFFVPLAAFAAWIAVMVVLLLRAIDQDVAEGAGEPAPAAS